MTADSTHSGEGSSAFHTTIHTVARGSFDRMDSPQMTMQSVEVSTEDEHSSVGVELAVPQPHHRQQQDPSTFGTTIVVVDTDENDDTGNKFQASLSSSISSSTSTPTSAVATQQHRQEEQHHQHQHHMMMGAPVSSRSVLSASSTDQILHANHRLDCSDSNAIFSYNAQHQQMQSSSNSSSRSSSNSRNRCERSSRTPPPPQRRLSLSNRTHSFRRSASKLSRHNFSRRPSMHETYDSEPLMRGEFLYYLYSFAILGTTVRMFLARFFGADCEFGNVTDFMSPLTQNICVTASGKTLQRGGALFLDLPANMLGSFIMGLVSSLNPTGVRPGSKLPWLNKDHPLQKHEGVHHAIKVGLCGSLTTFSSWNSQMILMMDGSETELGSQVIPALFGYIVGMSCASWSFTMGGRAHDWLYNWSNGIKDDQQQNLGKLTNDDEDEEMPPTSWDSEDSIKRSTTYSNNGGSTTSGAAARKGAATTEREGGRRERKLANRAKRKEYLKGFTGIMHKVIPFLISIVVLVSYGATVTDGNFQFFRELCACSLLTPVGVHLRWKLAALNGRGIGSSSKFEWMPWGTFTGNMLAVVCSVIIQAIQMKHRISLEDYPYILALMVGMKTGLAGSLSTVSSFVKEVANLGTIHPTHAKSYIYTGATLLGGMFLGLILYSPIIRYA